MSPRAGRSTNGGPGATMAETTERTISPAGRVLRRWRSHRRLSQMDLALRAGISARHLSFVETGRSAASREVLLSLAAVLRMPLRARPRQRPGSGAGLDHHGGHARARAVVEPHAVHLEEAAGWRRPLGEGLPRGGGLLRRDPGGARGGEGEEEAERGEGPDHGSRVARGDGGERLELAPRHGSASITQQVMATRPAVAYHLPGAPHLSTPQEP